MCSAMVARHERRGVSADDVGTAKPKSGALSVAERRAAKQRDRREKKRVEKHAIAAGAPADGGRDDDRRGRAAGTTTSDPADGPDLMPDEPYEYVGMFLDDGGDTDDDEDAGSSDDEEDDGGGRAAGTTTSDPADGPDLMPDEPYEYVGMFLDDGGDTDDDEDAAKSDDEEGDGDATRFLITSRRDVETRKRDDSDSPPDITDVETVRRLGSFGNYGRSDGRMSLEDDEWATSERTWRALSPYLSKYRKKKVWMPFYYDGEAGARLKSAGFERVVHRREDFFQRVRDSGFTRSVDVVIDNPPYTGKGMKEKVLRALVEADVPFCLLLPIGVLHGASIRSILDAKKTQALVPRRCFVFKKGKKEVPFKHLVWLCHGLNLPRDLELMPDDKGEGE